MVILKEVVAMPIDAKYGGFKKDKPAEAMAKGKSGKNYLNELFAQANAFMYEFGFISKPQNKEPQD